MMPKRRSSSVSRLTQEEGRSLRAITGVLNDEGVPTKHILNMENSNERDFL